VSEFYLKHLCWGSCCANLLQCSGTAVALARPGEYHSLFSHLFGGVRARKERSTCMNASFRTLTYVSLSFFQEVLELAFSILYDSSGQLNFIAPDKHEVSQVQSTEASLKPSQFLSFLRT